MGVRADQAEANFLSGYNCCQSVVCAFADAAGLTEEQACRLASSFGGGMGRLREVCGALTAQFMVTGLLLGSPDPLDAAAKVRDYARVQALARDFRATHGAILCRALLGVDGAEAPTPEARTPQYYAARPCARLVRSAAERLELLLKEEKSMKIAVTTEGDQIFQHFGKCPTFTLLTVENGQVAARETLDASEHGHAALAGFLQAAGVTDVICGGIGAGAHNMVEAAGIRLYSGVTGPIDAAVSALIDGKLADQGGSCGHHHEGGHDCSCGRHHGA